MYLCGMVVFRPMRLSVTAMIVALVGTVSCDMKNQAFQRADIKVEQLASPAGSSSAEPYLFSSGGDRAHLSWVEAEGDGYVFKMALLDGGTWHGPTTIARGDDWFVNWADYPMLAAADSAALVAFFMQKSAPDTYTYDILQVVSADAGATWSRPRVLHDDGVEAEHGFVSVVPFGAGFFVSWLDGRHTGSASHNTHGDHRMHGHGAMTLRAATLGPEGDKLSEWQLDDRVCDCCQTGVAVTASGPIVVYRDRSKEEIRDIHIVRMVNGAWTAPKAVFPDGWRIEGCPVNGPRVAATANTVAVAWFTAPDGDSRVNIAFSTDGGATFGTPIRVDGGNSLGRLGLVLLDEASAAVSWLENGQIQVTKVSFDGAVTSPIAIAETTNERASGFPQLVRLSDRLLFAWTDATEQVVKTALVRIDAL